MEKYIDKTQRNNKKKSYDNKNFNEKFQENRKAVYK